MINILLKIISAIVAIGSIVFTLCLCKASKMADERMEEIMRNKKDLPD